MQTKQILKNEKGEELVYINLSYPDFGSRKLKRPQTLFMKIWQKNFTLLRPAGCFPVP